MKLFIDASSSEKVIIGLGSKRFETEARQEKSQKLLPFIDKLLKKQKMTVKDIDEIEVNTGPGSFTGLRVGVSVASALGWALDVPVNGCDIRKGEIVEIKYE
jgi:tRNA threonylcarbamoyladenosine biosynthesis protein TsaB